jgi:ribonucleoside-diphosphate reductase alpha chain
VKSGIRNATLMAVAPNANIGLIAGTVPGMDARFSQVFSRNKISGKYLDINHNLVKDLKNMGIWEEVKGEIIEKQGDISEIEAIPEHIRNVYKTSFTNSPYAYVEVAARAQKWFDQAISRNIYLETRDIDKTMDLYFTAWEKGLKSTYYLHMKPRHTAEQSTVRVNKSEAMGRKGFGAIAGLERRGFNRREEDRVPSGEVITVTAPLIAEPARMVREIVEEVQPEPASVPENTLFETEEVKAETIVEETPTIAVRPGFKVHVPEDPQDSLICDSCQ